MFRSTTHYPAQTRGSCVSPSVHRQPALFRNRAGFTRASVERRSACPDRAPHRSGDRTTARFRVRRLRRPRGRRRGDPSLQPAAVQRASARGERGAPAGRTSGRSAARRLQRSTAGGRPLRIQQSSAWRLLTAAHRRWRRPRIAQSQLRPGRAAEEQAQAPRKDSDRGPKGPIKERPVGRLYDADEDWRAKDTEEELGIDNFATSAKDDEVEEEK